MAKKYGRCDWIPFMDMVDQTLYKRVERSKNPLETAIELEIVDTKKLKEIHKEIELNIPELRKRPILGLVNLALLGIAVGWWAGGAYILLPCLL